MFCAWSDIQRFEPAALCHCQSALKTIGTVCFFMVRHSAVRSRGTRFVDLTEIQASAIVGLHWPVPANFLLSFRVHEWRSMLQSCSLRVCVISMGLIIRRTTTLTHIPFTGVGARAIGTHCSPDGQSSWNTLQLSTAQTARAIGTHCSRHGN